MSDGDSQTLVLVNLAAIVEKADESVLPAVFLYVGRSFGVGPKQLGVLTLCRALSQALCSPISGFYGDRYDRTLVIASGCMLWGVTTAMIAMCTRLAQAMPLAAVNGLGLSLVIPCAQSLVADLSPSERRGRSFGTMQLTGSLGAVAASLMATNLGRMQPLGLDGWRAAFHLVALASLATGALVLAGAEDPRFRSSGCAHGRWGRWAGSWRSKWRRQQGLEARGKVPLGPGAEEGGQAGLLLAVQPAKARVQQRTKRQPCSEPPASDCWGSVEGRAAPASRSSSSPPGSCDSLLLLDAGSDASSGSSGSSSGSSGKPWGSGPLAGVLWMLRVRTFQAIVFQGIVGSIPWQAMSFTTLWLQLLGFSALQASTLLALSALGMALGGVIGGSLGDWAAQRRPLSGRIMVAQVSVASGIPLMMVLLLWLPSSGALRLSWAAYAAVMLAGGASISWSWAGCNSPIFAEVVPAELLSSVYAFDRSFEGALAACAAPVVGMLAEGVFGFKLAAGGDGIGQGQRPAAAAPAASVAAATAAAAVRGDVFGGDEGARAANAQALSHSMFSIMATCWTLCLLAYGVLYWAYPRDRLKHSRQGAGAAQALELAQAKAAADHGQC